jgi:hypothetical protein
MAHEKGDPPDSSKGSTGLNSAERNHKKRHRTARLDKSPTTTSEQTMETPGHQGLLAREAWRQDDALVEATKEACCVADNAPRVPCLACWFEDSGKFGAVRLLRSSGLGKDAVIKPGTHAFVRCFNENFLRLCLLATAWSEACGHPALANETPVLYAGEVEVNADQAVVRWSNLSGTYRCNSETAAQGLLPILAFEEGQYSVM